MRAAITTIVLISVIVFVTRAQFDGYSATKPHKAIRSLTPGATFPGVTASDVCSFGWASAHRHVTRTQRLIVFKSYHIAYSKHAAYELDHLIPLELGGSNSNKNLWPEPWADARLKDDLEDELHAQVCSRHLTLRRAWARIRRRYIK
jgi:hypothetical protein